MARDSTAAVLQSQITCAHIAHLHSVMLGRHQQALEEMLEFEKRLVPAQRERLLEQHTRMIVILANGRDDLLPDPPYQALAAMGPSLGTWATGLALHAVVRKGKTNEFLNTVPNPFPGHLNKGIYGHTLSLIHFSREKPDEAMQTLKNWVLPLMQPPNRPPSLLFRWTLGALVESQSAEAGEFIGPFIDQSTQLIENSDSEWVPAYMRARWAIEHGNFAEAVNHTTWVPDTYDRHLVGPLLLHIFLHSMGLHKSHSTDDLHRILSCLAAGAEFSVGNIMLGREEAEIGEHWPHPLWRPELRLWLGLWLEAKGDRARARAIAEPAIDQRYGMTHSQPALRKLIDRVSRG
jgi:hypothetical protein